MLEKFSSDAVHRFIYKDLVSRRLQTQTVRITVLFLLHLMKLLAKDKIWRYKIIKHVSTFITHINIIIFRS
jgi:hypothetical protein